MFNHRFVPYLIVVGIVVFLSVCYMGYREYQKHVEFETFMTKVQATLDKDANPPEHTEANPQGTDTNSSATIYPPHPIDTIAPPVKVAVVSKAEFRPIDDSEIPPETLAKMKKASAFPMKPQRIQTPDGNIHVIYLPEGEYKDGDIAVSEELASSPAAYPSSWDFDKLLSVQDSEIPEGETAESYLEKKRWSTVLGVSIEEVQKMMERGHIQRRNVSRSPVVEFPIEELIGDDHHHRSSGSIDEALPSGEHQSKVPVFDGRFSEDTQRVPVRSDVPVSPSDLPDIVKPISPPSAADIEKQLTSQGIEAELSGELSTDPFDKAQRLIDQYGTEEGLRRLREMDPEVARRFESDKSRPGRERRPVPSRDVPDGGQLESGSKN